MCSNPVLSPWCAARTTRKHLRCPQLRSGRGVSSLKTQTGVGRYTMGCAHAVRMHAPPASLILVSASLLKYFAFTMMGYAGR
jgi:hypothetical protein